MVTGAALLSRSFDNLHAYMSFCLDRGSKMTDPTKAIVLVAKIELLVAKIQP